MSALIGLFILFFNLFVVLGIFGISRKVNKFGMAPKRRDLTALNFLWVYHGLFVSREILFSFKKS